MLGGTKLSKKFTSPVDSGLLKNAEPLLIGNSSWTFEQLNLAIANAVPLVKELLSTRRINEPAEDVLNDVRGDIYRRIAHEPLPIENLFDYVAVAARNHVVGLSQEPAHVSSDTLEETADLRPTPEVNVVDEEQLNRLHKVLELFLTPKEWLLANQRYILHWSKEQMATVANTTIRSINRDLHHVRTMAEVITSALSLADQGEPMNKVTACLPTDYLRELATTDISISTAASKYDVPEDTVDRNRRYAKNLLNVAAHTHIFATKNHHR